MGATEELVLAALALTTMIVAQLTSHLNALYMNLCTTSRNSPAREDFRLQRPFRFRRERDALCYGGANHASAWSSDLVHKLPLANQRRSKPRQSPRWNTIVCSGSNGAYRSLNRKRTGCGEPGDIRALPIALHSKRERRIRRRSNEEG